MTVLNRKSTSSTEWSNNTQKQNKRKSKERSPSCFLQPPMPQLLNKNKTTKNHNGARAPSITTTTTTKRQPNAHNHPCITRVRHSFPFATDDGASVAVSRRAIKIGEWPLRARGQLAPLQSCRSTVWVLQGV